MIRRCFGALPELVQQDVYGIRTAAYHKTYGAETNEAAFYAQYADDVVTAVLSDAFGEGALTVQPSADMEELARFVRFLGLKSLLCARSAAEMLQLPVSESGSVMQYFGTETDASFSFIDARDPAFRFDALYALLHECGFSMGDYGAWFADFALRVRRGTADVRCILRDGRIVSSACVLFCTDTAQYLGAVATDPAFRGQGLAGGLVRSFARPRCRTEILCRPHRVSFYTSLDFQQNGEFAVCRFSE